MSSIAAKLKFTRASYKIYEKNCSLAPSATYFFSSWKQFNSAQHNTTCTKCSFWNQLSLRRSHVRGNTSKTEWLQCSICTICALNKGPVSRAPSAYAHSSHSGGANQKHSRWLVASETCQRAITYRGHGRKENAATPRLSHWRETHQICFWLSVLAALYLSWKMCINCEKLTQIC